MIGDRMYRAIRYHDIPDQSKNGRKIYGLEEKKQQKEFFAYSFPY